MPTDPIPEDVLKEAARRAVWEATRGPKHLRAGRYAPAAPTLVTPASAPGSISERRDERQGR